MRTRRGFVVCLAFVAAAACGSDKRSEPTPVTRPDEIYVNKDLAPLRAQLEAGLTQGAAATTPQQAVVARSYLAGFLVGATKLNPPAAWKASLDTLVDIATQTATAIDELQMAIDARSAEQQATAVASITAQSKRYAEWKTAHANGLASANITEAPLPPPPAPTEPPPKVATPMPCADGPCPCTATSIEKAGEVITSCMFTRDYLVSGVFCAVGRVSFDAKTGELSTCNAAAVFTPFPAATPAIACGPGPISRSTNGIESCVTSAEIVVDKQTIPATARVVFGANGVVSRFVTSDGKATCFAADRSAAVCPE